MEVRQLKCFVAAADLENFTAASERMNMSQSALSRQIANLEASLGTALFVRSGQGVSLSIAGQRLRDRAERLIAEFGELRTLVQADAVETVTGDVTVSASMASGGILFPRLARAAARDYPGLKLRFLQARSREAEASVLERKADFCVIAHAEPHDDLRVEPLFRQGLYIGYPPSLGVDLGPSCTVAEALAHPVAVPSGGREREFLDRLAPEHGLTMNVVDDVNGRLASALMMSYQGFVLLPGLALLDQKADSLRRFTRVQDVIVEVAMVERRDRPASDAIDIVKRMICKDLIRLQEKGVVEFLQ